MTNITLASPLTLKNGQIIKNRFMKSATSEQLADKGNNPTQLLATAYQAWAEGEVGLTITGNIMIDRNVLAEPLNVVLDEQSDFERFKYWTKSATVNGTQCWAQLNHPGKQVPIYLSKTPVAPSAIPLDMGALSSGFAKPRALETQEVWDIVSKFARTAALAKEVGFTGVQIHAAHGYLVNQFLSPSQNQRTDEWGGTPEKRMKFVLEIYHAIRKAVGDDFAVSIKLNSADFQKEGFSEAESMDVVTALTAAGIDHVEVSGGTYESQAMVGDESILSQGESNRISMKESTMKESTRKREAYFLAYAEKLRETTDVPLSVTGGFRSAAGMQDAIESGATDMVGLARPLVLFPDLPAKAMRDATYVAEFNYPTTGFKLLDDVAMINLTWYEEQIHLLGSGKQPDPNLNAWLSAFTTYLRLGKEAFRKRRA